MSKSRARISVYRPKRPYAKLRAYQVLIDGKLAGSVRDGAEVVLDVAPGKHAVQAKLDWCKSPALDVAVEPGSTVYLETVGRGFFGAFVDAFFRPSRYVQLRVREAASD